MAPSGNGISTVCSPKSITVYAASSSSVGDKYKEHAFELGQIIANEGWVQVNGGGYTGLMGAATQGALSVAGVVDAVILDEFTCSNMSTGFRNVTITNTMAARKAGLAERADAFIALPGGLGTLDELAEVLCNRQLSFHERPIVLVNTNGFYDSLKQFIIHATNSKFIAGSLLQAVCFADSPKEAIDFIKSAYKPVVIDRHALNSGEMEAASRKGQDQAK